MLSGIKVGQTAFASDVGPLELACRPAVRSPLLAWSMKLACLVFLGLALSFVARASDPLPAARKSGGVGWAGRVGVPGGIPNRTTIYANLPAGATASSIQSALDSCPSNQVVQLAAGTYTLSSKLRINRSGVTLRGAGMKKTILDISNASGSGGGVQIGTDDWYNEWTSPNSSLHRNWTGGYAQGSTVITVSDVSGLSVGKIILMDQNNDQDTSVVSDTNPDGPYVNLEYTSVAHPNFGYDRAQTQVNMVTAINGNNVTLSEPVYMPNWNAANNPQIWWFSAYSNPPWKFSGVEDLKIVTSHNDQEGVTFRYTYACWAKNVWVSGGGAHDAYFFPLLSLRTEIRHCLLDPEGHQSIDDYGIRTIAASGILVEDNIGNGCGTMIMDNGVSGSVYAYNYMTNLQTQSGQMTAGIYSHGGFPNMNLYEGNYAPKWDRNSQWNGSAYETCFRNRLVGDDETPISTVQNEPVEINATNRHHSVIGNVLGITGTHTVYEVTNCPQNETTRIYYLGLRSQGDCGSPFDPATYTTLIRAGNWDAATRGIVSNGYTPSDLPNSYYLTSKPAYFGNLNWPPVDPSNPTYSSSRTNIPAAYRFIFGVDPPGASNLPAPPSNLRVVSP